MPEAKDPEEKPSGKDERATKRACPQGATQRLVAKEEASAEPEEMPSGRISSSVGSYCPICRHRVSVRAKRHVEVNHLYQVGEWIGCQKGPCPSVNLQATGNNAQRAFGIPPDHKH